MPDPDTSRFREELRETTAGRRYEIALSESHIAIYQIKMLSAGIPGRGFGPGCLSAEDFAKLERWRHAYIASCEAASRAIGELWAKHHWPPDAHHVAFEFKPWPKVRR